VERRVADQQSAELEFLARHDSLTGLMNRRAFAERLEGALARCRRYGRRAALLAIDLDGFKPVNDAHGHGIGDELLQHLAARIAALMWAVELEGRVIEVAASIGTAIFPESGEDSESLMRSADRAMYEAKSAGGAAVCVHRPEPRAAAGQESDPPS
jgi:GGDEF domain-containing protein